MTPTRALALFYGLICHSLFALAITLMAVNLYTGMGVNIGPFEGGWAIFANLLLMMQFPLLHSFLLTDKGRRLLGHLAPESMRRELGTTLFAAASSAQLVLVFGLWSPLGGVLWEASGGIRLGFLFAFGASWLLLGKSMWDAGLGLQTGSMGWWALFKGQRPRFGSFPVKGLFAYCRQPIYLAFALILWTSPVMTFDRLVLAIVWSAYCVVGPRLKELRVAKRHGPAFEAYQARVPYFLPKLPLRGLGQSEGAQA